MDKKNLAVLFEDIVGIRNIKVDEPLSNHTSIKVGGPADILVTPVTAEQISEIQKLCLIQKVPLFIMGNGSNLIVRDKGIRGVVLKLFGGFNKFNVDNDAIEAEAGVLLSKLSNIALENGLSGLEFASCIPGTLGGAITMNAGAYGGEMKDVVTSTSFVTKDGKYKTIYSNEHGFGKRTSYFILNEGNIILKSVIRLNSGNSKEIKELMDDLNNQRRCKQPLEIPSAGSIFKRTEGHFTGRLIEDCGLKGYRFGGAEISSKHCGFIVNTGGASAADIINLIYFIEHTVKSRFGVDLQTEVRIVGEE